MNCGWVTSLWCGRTTVTDRNYSLWPKGQMVKLLTCISWWRHQMETFSALLVICAGNSPVTGEFPHKGQWRENLMFSLVCTWTNSWANNEDAGDFRRHCAHYGVIVIYLQEQLHGFFLSMSKCCLNWMTPWKSSSYFDDTTFKNISTDIMNTSIGKTHSFVSGELIDYKSLLS